MCNKLISVIYKGRCQDILASLPFLRDKQAHLYIETGKRITKLLALQLKILLEAQPYIASVLLCTSFNKYDFKKTTWDDLLGQYTNYNRHHILDCTHWMDPRWRAINSLDGDARLWLFQIYNLPYILQPFLCVPKIAQKPYAAIAYQQRYLSVLDFSDIQLTIPKVVVPTLSLINAAIIINSSAIYIGNNLILNWLALGVGTNNLIAKSYGSDLITLNCFRGKQHLKDILNGKLLLKESDLYAYK